MERDGGAPSMPCAVEQGRAGTGGGLLPQEDKDKSELQAPAFWSAEEEQPNQGHLLPKTENTSITYSGLSFTKDGRLWTA